MIADSYTDLGLTTSQTNGKSTIAPASRLSPSWSLAALVGFLMFALPYPIAESSGTLFGLLLVGLAAISHLLTRKRKPIFTHFLDAQEVSVEEAVYPTDKVKAVRIHRFDNPIIEIELTLSEEDPVLVHRWDQTELRRPVPIGEAIRLGEQIAEILGVPAEHNDG